MRTAPFAEGEVFLRIRSGETGEVDMGCNTQAYSTPIKQSILPIRFIMINYRVTNDQFMKDVCRRVSLGGEWKP